MSNLDLKMTQMLVPVAKYGVKCPYAMTIEFDEAKYEDNIARHTFPKEEGKGVDVDE